MNPLSELDALISRIRLVDRRGAVYELVLYLVLISIGLLLYLLLLTWLSIHFGGIMLALFVLGPHTIFGFSVIVQGVKTGRRLKRRTTFVDSQNREGKRVYYGTADDIRRVFERWEMDAARSKQGNQDDIVDVLLFLFLVQMTLVVAMLLMSEEYLPFLLSLPIVLALLVISGMIHSYITSPSPPHLDLLNHLEFYILDRLNALESAFNQRKNAISLLFGRKRGWRVIHEIGFCFMLDATSKPILEYRLGLSSSQSERFLLSPTISNSVKSDVAALLPKAWSLSSANDNGCCLVIGHRYRDLDISDSSTYLLSPSRVQGDTEEVVRIAGQLLGVL
ncbi:hypothetical protein EU538_06800 [Candidatus Thorarchaeota archaeon]|nr:MAG: hypothetical protein EU538_06800 [Candidatus Thorarchaeota archaeon]